MIRGKNTIHTFAPTREYIVKKQLSNKTRANCLNRSVVDKQMNSQKDGQTEKYRESQRYSTTIIQDKMKSK